VTVWAKATGPGFHYWSDAPDNRDYLRDRHRHLFHLMAEVEVTHDDRDVEFHDLQDAIRAWWGPDALDLGPTSCESIARSLAGHLAGLGMRVVSVEVAEDGENGATLRFNPPLVKETA